jgi:hypothetical protein
LWTSDRNIDGENVVEDSKKRLPEMRNEYLLSYLYLGHLNSSG